MSEQEKNLYYDALFEAWGELQRIKEQERELAIRKAQLSKTVSALFPLVFPDSLDVNTMSLPNAIRLIMSGADRPLSATDIQTKLEDLGFDLKKFENPLANIHTAMKRMAENDELVLIDGDRKRVTAGPELKPAPDMSAGDWEAVMARMMPEGGLDTPPPPESPGKKK